MTSFAEVIGDPVAHSKSPAIHAFWLEKLGLAGEYRARRVRADGLPAYLAERRGDPAWRGCNVTMPLKQAILPYLAGLDETARTSGAVNIVTAGGVGHNSDIIGVADALLAAGSNGPVRVIGTGGAARAAVAGAIRAGHRPTEIVIYGRDPQKAREAASSLGCDADQGRTLIGLAGEMTGGGVLINATPLGMTGHPELDLDLAPVSPGTIIFDMVYRPVETELLFRARQRGLRTIDGLEMLIGQAARAFALFFGADAPRGHDAELRERLLR